MTLTVTHRFVSQVAPTDDDNLVKTSYWNENHVITGTLDPSQISPIAANTLLANPTGASAAPIATTLGATLAFVGGTSLQTLAMTGDVASSANSFVTTIQPNVVDNTKFRQGAARSVVGVTGNATANVADIQGTADQVLRINSAGTALAFGQVNLSAAAAITGSLPLGNIAAIANNTLLGNSSGSSAVPAVQTLGATLAFSAGSLQTTALSGDVTTSANSFVTTISANAVSNAKFRQSAGLSVVGNSTNALANVADITGTTDQVLRVSAAGTTIGFGAVNLGSGPAVSGVLSGVNGGTGLGTAAVGDIIYASATTPTWSRLAAVATGSILASAGVNTAPAWSASPTLTTSLTVPQIFGGTAAGSSLSLRSTSNGSPSADFVDIWAAGKQRILVANSGLMTINQNAAAVPTSAVAGVNLVALDATAAGYSVNSFGSSASLILIRADGTNAIPTKLLSTELIGATIWRGYDNSGVYSGAQARIQVTAAEDWNGTTNRGTTMALQTTPTASGTLATGITIAASGGVSIGATAASTDAGLGNILVQSTAKIGIAGTALGVITVSGNTSGTITMQPQAAAGTYNWNWPITAGTAGQILTSQAGGSTAMTWTTPGTGTVTSVATGVGLTGGTITTTGTLAVSLTTATNVLGADVLLNNTANYFDGPSVSMGTGVWYVSGAVVCIDTAGAASVSLKLWDGTTIISSGICRLAAASTVNNSVTLSGIITNPAANVRISARDTTSTSGKLLFNNSGNSADCYIWGVRIG